MEKVGWCQKKLEETRILILKASVALYLIRKTKSIILPHVTKAGTSTNKKLWTPDTSESRKVLNRFDTLLQREGTTDAGKINPRHQQIVSAAIAGIENDSSIGIKEKQLTRHVKEIHKKTAKEYGGHFVRQNFGGKIKGVSKL